MSNDSPLHFYKTIQSGLDNLEIENIYIDATHVSKRSRVKILNCLKRIFWREILKKIKKDF